MLFFSSRRRHTRYWRDWSSDVCSSDLRHVLAGQEALYQVSRDTSAARDPQEVLAAIHAYLTGSTTIGEALWQAPVQVEDSPDGSGDLETWRSWFSRDWPDGVGFDGLDKIGRASCRERV